MLQTQKIHYQDGNVVLEGYMAMDAGQSGKRPAVLVAPDWSGRNEFADKKAEKLAELGYIGFAIDMYGNGQLGNTNEEKTALMQPLMQDRDMLRQRILAGLTAIKSMPEVDPTKIGAIGFCFGGLCVLDLARSGADVRGVVSFHGLLNAPTQLPDKKMLAKVLALQGHDDPMVLPEQVTAFENEMTKQQVDWQLMIYGGTQHAFTNPLANDAKLGTVYKEIADKRSWITMKDFFAEVL